LFIRKGEIPNHSQTTESKNGQVSFSHLGGLGFFLVRFGGGKGNPCPSYVRGRETLFQSYRKDRCAFRQEHQGGYCGESGQAFQGTCRRGKKDLGGRKPHHPPWTAILKQR